MLFEGYNDRGTRWTFKMEMRLPLSDVRGLRVTDAILVLGTRIVSIKLGTGIANVLPRDDLEFTFERQAEGGPLVYRFPQNAAALRPPLAEC